MTDDELARHVADAKRAGDMIDASTVDGLLAGIERLQRENKFIDAEREFVESCVVEFTESKHRRQRDEARVVLARVRSHSRPVRYVVDAALAEVQS